MLIAVQNQLTKIVYKNPKIKLKTYRLTWQKGIKF